MKASLKHKNNEGFSLIELVVVVAVLAILAAIGIPSFNAIIKQALLAITKTSLIDNYKQCKMNSDGEINLSNIPGVVFQSNDCASDITATINSECTLKMNMSTGAKTGWTDSYDQCVSATNTASNNTSEGKGGGDNKISDWAAYTDSLDETSNLVPTTANSSCEDSWAGTSYTGKASFATDGNPSTKWTCNGSGKVDFELESNEVIKSINDSIL